MKPIERKFTPEEMGDIPQFMQRVNCNEPIKMSSGFITGPNETDPLDVGTLTICPNCTVVQAIAEGGVLRLGTMEEARAATHGQDAEDMFKHLVGQLGIDEDKIAYAASMVRMRSMFKTWIAHNKNAELQIAYPGSADGSVCVIATLLDAVNNGLVTLNKEARRAVTECGWLDVGPDMPTVAMVKIVTEI